MEMMKSQVKEQLNIIYRPHPVIPVADCKYAIQPWTNGQTVRQVLIANGIDQHQPISVILNDKLLTVQEWDTVCPDPCSIINVKAEVTGGGGGGGSNTMQIVAMVAIIAIAIIAPYAAPATWGLTTLTAAGTLTASGLGMAVSAGIMIAGQLLIGAIFSPKVQATNMDDISGSNTSSSPTYSLSGGSNKARPYEPMPVIMGTHRFFPDAAANPYTEFHGEDQFLYQIFGMGLSSATFSDYKIGNTALTDYSDYQWKYSDSDGRISAFPGNVDTAAGALLEKSIGWITRTTSVNTYKIGIDLEGMLYYANDSGGMSETSVQVRIQYRPTGTSTWLDPVDIEVNGVGFVDGQYKQFQEYVSSGYYQYDEDGNATWINNSYYQTVTRFVNNGGTVIVSGSSQTPRRATLFITPATTGQYDVRIIRDTNDSTSSRLSNKINWSNLKSYQVDNGIYTGITRYGMSIRASEQLNGSIQQLSTLAVAKARYYNGSAWTFGETSNPAHWFMDFAIGRYDSAGKLTYGIGLTASQIDLAQLSAWATFCTTEGLTFNAVLDGTQTAADILTTISRCGFGSPTWSSGKLGVVWDARNKTPVAAFGMSNIIKGSFEVRYITEQLADEIVVRYVDPEKDWNQNEVRVVVPGVTNPLNTTTVDILGCTNKIMAGKFANYLAAQQYYRRRRVTWDCDFEGFVCQRGDVVLLSHDLTQWAYSGRIVDQSEVTTNLLTYSQTFSDASWTKSNCTIGSTPIQSPIQDLTAYKLQSSVTTNTNKSFYKSVSGLLAGQTITTSFYLKAAERTWALIQMGTTGSAFTANQNAYFNIGAGIVGSTSGGCTSTITDAGNGWYRCTITATTVNSGATRIRLYSAEGDADITMVDTIGAGIYPWGGQVEIRSSASNYIATTSIPVSAGGNVLTLDRELPRNGSTEYLMIKQPDGTMTTYSVIASIDTSNTITLSSVPSLQSGYELLDHVWFFSPLSTPGKKVKIISVQPISESRIQVVATDEDSEFYAAWDGSFIEPPNNSLLLNKIPVVSNIKVAETIYRGTDNSIKSHVSVTWDSNGVWDRANVRYRVGNDVWTKLSTTTTKFEFDTSQTGTISIEIVPIYGVTVGAPVSYTGTIFGIVSTLPNVTGFTDFYRDGKTVLTWQPVADPRTIDYEIRKGTAWATAEVLGRVSNTEFTAIGNGLYWVAAHTGSIYSPTPVSLQIDESSLVANVIATWDEEATGWSGTLGGGAIIDGTNITLRGTGLVSTIPVFSQIASLIYYGGVATSGTYEIPAGHEIDLGYAAECSVSVSYRMQADSALNLVSLIPVFSAIPSLIGNYAGQADVRIQMAIAPASGVYGDWRDFVPASYYGRKFKFRALLTSINQDVYPILDTFTFSVDVPDRIETGNSVAVSTSGLSVTYTKPFQVAPNVQITIVSASASDDAVLTSQTASGFNIVVNNAGSPVARTINWVAQGY